MKTVCELRAYAGYSVGFIPGTVFAHEASAYQPVRMSDFLNTDAANRAFNGGRR